MIASQLLPAFLGPLALYSLATSITPGPNNVMLAASGMTFGFRRTLPHMLGITIGVSTMLLLVGVGLGEVFQTMPWIYTTLQYVGGAYLLWLAYRIASAGPAPDGQVRGRPFGFWQAAAFQWINPKAWIMAVGIIAAYTPQNGFLYNLALATVVSALVNFPSIGVWTLFGSSLRRLMHRPVAVRAFNLTMAALLLASLYPLAVSLIA